MCVWKPHLNQLDCHERPWGIRANAVAWESSYTNTHSFYDMTANTTAWTWSVLYLDRLQGTLAGFTDSPVWHVSIHSSHSYLWVDTINQSIIQHNLIIITPVMVDKDKYSVKGFTDDWPQGHLKKKKSLKNVRFVICSSSNIPMWRLAFNMVVSVCVLSYS